MPATTPAEAGLQSPEIPSLSPSASLPGSACLSRARGHHHTPAAGSADSDQQYLKTLLPSAPAPHRETPCALPPACFPRRTRTVPLRILCAAPRSKSVPLPPAKPDYRSRILSCPNQQRNSHSPQAAHFPAALHCSPPEDGCIRSAAPSPPSAQPAFPIVKVSVWARA